MKSLDPLRAKKIFIRKKLGHTAVSAIKAEKSKNTKIFQICLENESKRIINSELSEYIP